MKLFPQWEVRPPRWIRMIYPGTFWRGEGAEKEIYLTLDDGPVPEVTPWVCEELQKRDVKATFFCVGENVKKHPEIYRMIIEGGHKTGNHTFNHKQAWKCSGSEYFGNIEQAGRYISSDLFRPPHGQLYPWQVPELKKLFTRIVMWDVLSKDYDNRLGANEVFENVKQFVRPGSVIVFHDSVKAWPRLKAAFPQTLDYLLGEGYMFKVIS